MGIPRRLPSIDRHGNGKCTFSSEAGDKAGIELWAMRCRHRLADVLKIMSDYIDTAQGREPNFHFGLDDITRELIPGDTSYGRYLSHDPENLKILVGDDSMHEIQETYMQLAREIVLRAQFDDRVDLLLCLNSI